MLRGLTRYRQFESKALSNMDDVLLRQIYEIYQKSGNLHKTAKELGFAYAKVRKALITYGAYSTRFSDEAYDLRRKGYSVEEIAKELNASAKRVSAWLPYEKSIYNLPEKTKDAARSSNYRKRNERARANLVLAKHINEKERSVKMRTKIVLNSNSTEKERIGSKVTGEPIRIHLKLHREGLDEDERRILKKYGRSSTGNSIERDILIPHDMTLHALHYAILRLYGWQNGHLHSFHLPDEVYKKLTNNTVRGWGNLIGVLFQSVYPENVWDVRYGDDDYEYGSIKTWLKKKYTGPYQYLGWYEQYDVAVSEFNDFTEHFQNMAVYEPFDSDNSDKSREDRIVKHAPVIDLTLDELNESIFMEDSTNDLLERITVSSILAYKGGKKVGAEKLGQKMIKRWYKGYGEVLEPEVRPITDKLFYRYDYGDGWIVEITRTKDCGDLIENGMITEDELAEAISTVIETYRPVCIRQDGMRLVDDVGGFGGFIKMLRILYESDEWNERLDPNDPDTKEYVSIWAHSMGWSARKISNKQML